ncbi:hypothetical protein A2Z33_05805 [Candidatus Gottesmanbacteria bacterium RBG_16_52_11]|uniref:HD/PDEase domain-containing protein n=1 Tax=Candidatus Gottesmanbacteria bacterium RBG_16_52_11 TaxID=1798374 RepID=A0A1F5YXE4_9BACT|nr:MAG: hypothetical protein A2Z33_05805 [Candidatus Gottesmanbacteria bacterium RBG_16_52_11]
MKVYTPLIGEAIRFAVAVHAGQIRKGTTIPYITHPLTVALILARVTDDPEVIAAGILHDTIEDAEPRGSVTRKDIGEKFGKTVAVMVDDVTEQDKSLPWTARKSAALDHIPEMGKKSLLLKTADVLANLSDQVEDVRTGGEKIFLRFNATKKAQLDRYVKLTEALQSADPENPLLPDLKEQLSALLTISK